MFKSCKFSGNISDFLILVTFNDNVFDAVAPFYTVFKLEQLNYSDLLLTPWHDVHIIYNNEKINLENKKVVFIVDRQDISYFMKSILPIINFFRRCVNRRFLFGVVTKSTIERECYIASTTTTLMEYLSRLKDMGLLKNVMDSVIENHSDFRIEIDTTQPISEVSFIIKNCIETIAKRDKNLFRYGNILSSVENSNVVIWDDKICPSKITKYLKFVSKENEIVPSSQLTKLILSIDYEIPSLVGLVKHPMISTSGCLLNGRKIHNNGIYTDTDFELCYDTVFDYRSIQSKKDVNDFVNKLLNEYFCDFFFESESSKGVFLSALISPLVCDDNDVYPVPMHVFDANMPGVGKTLLASLICRLYSKDVKLTTLGTEEELKKYILSLIRQCGEFLYLDDFSGVLSSKVLDAFLTTTFWSDRLLGSNTVWSGKFRILTYMTGNNILISNDGARRCIRCRLVSPVERPELRTSFKYPNIIEFFQDHRDSFLSCLIQCYRIFLQDKIEDYPRLGSYEWWSKYIASFIHYTGLPNPIISKRSMYDEDLNYQVMCDLMGLLSKFDEGEGICVSDLLRKLKMDSVHDDEIFRIKVNLEQIMNTSNITPGLLSRFLQRYKDMPINGKKITVGKRSSSGVMWRIVEA